LISLMVLPDFDSTIRRFDPSRPSQKLSGQNNEVANELGRVLIDSMSRHVAKISVCFQGFPIVAGGSTRHGRNMVCASSKCLSIKRDPGGDTEEVENH
jgi:hypothetical protein